MPAEYFEVINLGNVLFPALYQFENGLRLVLDRYLSTCYGTGWWDDSLRTKLPDVFLYAENQKKKLEALSWIGASSRVSLLPVHLITLGLLEEVVKAYKSECIPELFPSLDFFTGHMLVIKRVRNLYSHMFPCLTRSDCTIATNEIRTLAAHLNTRLG